MNPRPLNLSGDERALAGRLGGALWLFALPFAALALALPDVPGRHPHAALLVAAAATVWGLIALFVVDWEGSGAAPYHALAAISVVTLTLLVATTGGARSSLWPAFFLVVAYCSYFYPVAQAVPYLVACTIAQSLPLIYQSEAVQPSFAGELIVAAVAYAAVAAVIVLGKLQLVALRDTAERLSLHDSLTGLPNRRALLAELEERLERRGEGTTVALLLIDLDNFKDVNTLYGHPAGDGVLCAAAQALSQAVRPGDTLARLGGDEFAVVAAGAGDELLASLPDRLIDAVDGATAELDMAGISLGASVGWARHPADAHDAEELTAAADVSLRTAKALGKGVSQSPLDWLPEPQRA